MSAEEISPEVEAYLDDLTEERVRGWAWMPADPLTVVEIELVDGDGVVVAKTQAQLFRGDLETAGKRNGRCEFDLSIPEGQGPYMLRACSPLHSGGGVVLAEQIDAPSPRPRKSLHGQFKASSAAIGWLDRADALEISGWCHGPDPFGRPVALRLVERGLTLAKTIADRWREDLQDLRQGDGVCGFCFVPPDSLYDNGDHPLEIWLEDGEPLTEEPVWVRFPAGPPARPALISVAKDPPILGPPVISIIVNFYNMRREAVRTLQSMTRRFQLDVEAVSYEVLCIDNGSDPPLDEEFITSFGPEFRLLRPSVAHPSPCRALNEAAKKAQGRWIAVMIDGAHILSPGVLREAHAVLKSQPDAIVALRQWFIGGDQRWFSSAGYRQEQEDVLYPRINWPNDGYKLFDISSPMYESPNAWLDGMSESNCLFVSRAAFQRIGGFDEAFDIPGAGYANLDFFRRAYDAASELVALVGEASFHQYHGGVTTNAQDAKKDGLVRLYASQYERLRGAPFSNVPPEKMRLSGRIQTGLALTGRQRPFCPANVGVTSQVRPRPTNIQFDEGAQQYIQSAYVETGLHLESLWRGQKVEVAPADLIDIQEALWRVKPERVILRGVAPGLVSYIASLMPTLDLQEAKIIWVTECPQAPMAGTQQLAGPLDGDEVLAQIEAAVGDADHVMVIYNPDADCTLPVDSLTRYSRFVTFSSYFVILRTAFGQPWLGYAQSWLYRAIVHFTQSNPSFVIDRTLNRQLVTTSPSGFIRRVLAPHSFRQYDESIDDLTGI